MKPQALVITGYGINCEEETAYVFNLTGSQATITHINDLITNPGQLDNYQILAFPGGFSYGDDTGSGKALANKIKNNVLDAVLNFAAQDKLIIGICNGFQVITQLGLLPNADGKQTVALMHNASNRYICQWVHVKSTSQKCIWTRDIDQMHLPIAHGEGNFYTDPDTLSQLIANDQIALRYHNGNPNGALDDIAGLCDPSGRILGLMPHPERFNAFTNEVDWDIKKESHLRAGQPLPKTGDGLKVFTNAANYFQ